MATNYKRLTLDQRLQKFPPFLCLALSRIKIIPFSKKEAYERWKQRRKGRKTKRRYQWRRMNREEISALSGIHYKRVSRIGRRISWDGVKVRDMLAFMKACNVDVCHATYQREFMKYTASIGQAFRHLNPDQRRIFVATMRRYKEAMASSVPSSPELPSAQGNTPHQ